MGEGKRGLGGFPLGERRKVSGIYSIATVRGEVKDLPVLSTFGVPRTSNHNICMKICLCCMGRGKLGKGRGDRG